MQDAKGVFKVIEPEVFTEANETVKVWDAEGFTTAVNQRVKMYQKSARKMYHLIKN